MKQKFFFCLLFIFQICCSQIQFGPALNHSIQRYTATIQGSGRIYYTTDGTDPTITSSSALNLAEIEITHNVILKAKLKAGNNQLSETYTRPYYIGELPHRTVYFKPPSAWTDICSYMNFIQPEYLVDFSGPGNPMISACEGWYKSSFDFYKAMVSFNNCKAFAPPPIYESYSVVVEDTVFYDYSAGPITNPPLCLLNIDNAVKKLAIVKVFPNPVKDLITIKSELKFEGYELIDASGKTVFKSSVFKKNIDVSSLPKGLYYIKLNSSRPENTIVKFIKN